MGGDRKVRGRGPNEDVTLEFRPDTWTLLELITPIHESVKALSSTRTATKRVEPRASVRTCRSKLAAVSV